MSFHQLGFGRQDMGVFEDVVGHAQLFRHVAVIFQFQWLSLAGKIVELALALGFEDALLGEPFDETDCAGGLGWASYCS